MADDLDLLNRACIVNESQGHQRSCLSSSSRNQDDDAIHYYNRYRQNERSYWSSSIPLSELRRFATDSSLYHRNSRSSLYSHAGNDNNGSADEGVEEEPSGWSCPVINEASVIHRPPLCLYRPAISNSNGDPALVVANRPITLLIPHRTGFGAHLKFHKLYPTCPKTENPWDTPNYYYFEVTLLFGSFFIGFISSDHIMTIATSIPVKGKPTFGQLCEENNTHNFPITIGTFPGKVIHSIGLEIYEGNLYIHGEKKSCCYSNALSSIKPGDVIGVGLERDYSNSERQGRVFFTRNGKVIHPNEQGKDDFPLFLQYSDSVASVFPCVGVMGGSKILGNFRKGSFLFSPQPQAYITKDHLNNEIDSDAILFADDGSINSATLLDTSDLEGSQISKEEENAIERAKQLSLEDTLSIPMVENNDAIYDFRAGSVAKEISPTSKELEDIDLYSKQLRRYLHDLGAHDKIRNDEALFQNLTDLCRGARKKVASAIQSLTEINDEHDEDTLSTLLAANAELNDVLEEADKLVDVHAWKTIKREVSAPSDSDKEEGRPNDRVKEICSSSKFYFATHKVSELAEKKDIFNLICLLRSEARKEAAMALLKYVQCPNFLSSPTFDAFLITLLLLCTIL